jgi:hypothetical protein
MPNTQLKYYWIFTALFIIFNPDLAFAQDKNETFAIKVQDLVVPNAPASAIIGSQISLKPAITPKAFGLSILNSISNEEGEFPNNIAVEFTPYWWSPKPNLTFDNYYNKNGFGQFIPQSLSFSIASEADKINVDDNEIDVTKLGLGLRFALIAGKANPLVEQAKNSLLKELKDCLELIEEELNKGRILEKKLVEDEGQLEEKDFLGLIETMNLLKTAKDFDGQEAIVFDTLQEKIKILSNSQAETHEKKNQLKEILSQISQELYGENIDENNIKEIIVNISNDAGNVRNDKCLQERNKKIGDLNAYLKNLDEKARVGLQLESASAVGFDFREDDFDEFRFRNFATWLTASYRGKKSSVKEASPIEFLGVARYTFDELEDDTNNFFDVGAGLVYRLQKTPLAFSLEYVRRFGDDEDDRFVGVADYRINNTYSVFLSYGKDFEEDFNGNGDVVTLFGLKVGLGRESAVTEIFPSVPNPPSESATD